MLVGAFEGRRESSDRKLQEAVRGIVDYVFGLASWLGLEVGDWVGMGANPLVDQE